MFCSGIGADSPDVANASRPIKPSELEQCAKNGVTDVAEVKIGYDGILIATTKGAPAYKLTRHALFLALAKQVPDPKNPAAYLANPYKNWSQVDPSLPAVAISVFGPAPNHGTRDAFAELALEPGCQTFPALKALKDSNEDQYKKICTQVREDGAWTDVSEDYALVMGKLASNLHALAVFTFSYLDSEPRETVGGDRGWHRDFRRIDRARRVPAVAAAVLLRQEGARRRDSGHEGIHRRIYG